MDRASSELQSHISDQDPTEVRFEENHEEKVRSFQASTVQPQQKISLNNFQHQLHNPKFDTSKSTNRINICIVLYEAQFLSETIITFEISQLFSLYKLGEIQDIALKKNLKDSRLYLKAVTEFKYDKERLEFLMSQRLGRAKILKVTTDEINSGLQKYSLDHLRIESSQEPAHSQRKQTYFREKNIKKDQKFQHDINEEHVKSKLEEPQLEKKVCPQKVQAEISTAQTFSGLNSELMRYVLLKLQVQDSILTQLHLFLNIGQNLVYGIINFFVTFWCQISKRNFTLINQESLSYQKHFDNTIKNQTLILPILQNQVWEFYIFYQESYSLLWGGVKQNENVTKQVSNYFEMKNQPLEVSTCIIYPPLLQAFESGVYLLIYLYNIIVNGIKSQLAIDSSYIPQFLNFLHQQSTVAQMNQDRQNV